MNIYLELFGYLGTALVILSMMMTSVSKLRVFNICGSVISMSYAVMSNAWPVAVLNLALIIINTYKLLSARLARRGYTVIGACSSDEIVQYFLSVHRRDIEKCYPSFFEKPCDAEGHLVLFEEDMAGIILIANEENEGRLIINFTAPKYRGTAAQRLLGEKLAELDAAKAKYYKQ